MLSKTKIAYLRSLHNRKDRENSRRFLVEWKKSILEVLQSNFRVVEGFFVHDFLSPLQKTFPMELISEKELLRISSLSSNRDGILVVEMPQNNFSDIDIEKFSLVLDGINDPGNLWTIIRIADWYSISHVFASKDTVDVFNAKTIMATMGSFTRVQVNYVDLEEFLTNAKIPVYGAFLDGENIHKIQKPQPWYIVIGSEAHGIRPYIQQYITHKITIPRFGGAESLNAWVATGIIVDRFVGNKK